MGSPSAEFEEIVIEGYRNLLKAEAALLRRTEGLNINTGEMNIIGAVGRGDAPTISEIGESLNISPPSVTDGVNRMVRKGLAVKERDKNDARIVRVRLTKAGERLYEYQKYYLRSTLREIAEVFNEDELLLLRKAVVRINDVFGRILEKQ